MRKVIRREFGVALSAVSVDRLLRTIGLSPQRPLFRAYSKTPRPWTAIRLRSILRSTRTHETGRHHLLRRQAGVRSDYHVGITWAPVGRTPVVRTTGDRLSVNMIFASQPLGRSNMTSCMAVWTPPIHRLLRQTTHRHRRSGP